MQSETQNGGLRLAAAIVIAFGALVALAAHPATAGITAFFADLVFWPLDGAPRLDAPVTRLMCAICGGVLVGWGVLLWHVAAGAIGVAAAQAIRSSVIAWFVVDSTGSIIAGAPLNALLNVPFLLLFLIPLARGPAASPAQPQRN